MSEQPPTYDGLFDLTRGQAHQIERLRAKVDRLKKEAVSWYAVMLPHPWLSLHRGDGSSHCRG